MAWPGITTPGNPLAASLFGRPARASNCSINNLPGEHRTESRISSEKVLHSVFSEPLREDVPDHISGNVR